MVSRTRISPAKRLLAIWIPKKRNGSPKRMLGCNVGKVVNRVIQVPINPRPCITALRPPIVFIPFTSRMKRCFMKRMQREPVSTRIYLEMEHHEETMHVPSFKSKNGCLLRDQSHVQERSVGILIPRNEVTCIKKSFKRTWSSQRRQKFEEKKNPPLKKKSWSSEKILELDLPISSWSSDSSPISSCPPTPGTGEYFNSLTEIKSNIMDSEEKIIQQEEEEQEGEEQECPPTPGKEYDFEFQANSLDLLPMLMSPKPKLLVDMDQQNEEMFEESSFNAIEKEDEQQERLFNDLSFMVNEEEDKEEEEEEDFYHMF